MIAETRRIDDLHRMVIPKKMCDKLGIEIGGAVDILQIGDIIILSKHDEGDERKESK